MAPSKRGGGHAGHNGLRSLHNHLDPAYTRVRIGVGHPGRKEAVPGYVLRDFPKADDDWLEPLLDGISDGAAELAAGDAGKFQNRVALRTAPPRSSTSKPAKSPKPEMPPEPQADTRTALQRLVDKFR